MRTIFRRRALSDREAARRLSEELDCLIRQLQLLSDIEKQYLAEGWQFAQRSEANKAANGLTNTFNSFATEVETILRSLRLSIRLTP
jgi:hypothetical protein